MKKENLFMLVVIGLLSGCSSVTIAGEYYLIEKSRYIDKERFDICEKLVENFNRFKHEPPVVCELKFSSHFQDFVVPNWQKDKKFKKVEEVKTL